MVKIENNPRLQIACNTVVQEGMEISNQDEQVKDAVKWGLDFHLINHPLDCPICDQAGECELQIQYMKFGQYDPEMAEPKVTKRKVVDLGSKIVLDTERCILCTRCVRFTDEVSKTNELGIFNRGDRSEVGTYTDMPLENNYAMNTVDICPVGALTSKDFRFRQRVWYLKNHDTICTSCSTGCSVKTYYNEEGFFRVRPVYNENVNGYWMCDKGRDIYKFVNKEARLLKAIVAGEELSAGKAVQQLRVKLDEAVKQDIDSIALVVTGQYTNEEYRDAFKYFVNKLGIKNVFHWINNEETFDSFDNILLRGDRNPNTAGLKQAMSAFKVGSSWQQLESKLNSTAIKTVIVLAPENQSVYPTLNDKVELFSKADQVVWLTACPIEAASEAHTQIPLKTFVEKNGTYTNYKGVEQKVTKATTVVAGALSLSDAVKIMQNEHILINTTKSEKACKTNYFAESSLEVTDEYR